METYTCSEGWRRHVLPSGTEIVEGYRFTPAPRGETGAFGGGHRDCAPAYPVAETPERATEIARQRGEDVESGKVIHVYRDCLGDCWRPMVCLREDIAVQIAASK